MLTSKELLERTGISRATLNNYIAAGLLPKPEVKRASPAPGEPLTTLGYFPDSALARVIEIQSMKKSGISMQLITQRLLQQSLPAAESLDVAQRHQPQLSGLESRTEPLINVKNAIKASETLLKPDELNPSLVSQTEELSATPSDSANSHRNHENKNDKNQINKTYRESNLLNNQVQSSGNITVSIEDFPYPAYLMSYDFHVIWLNDACRKTHFPNGHIPERLEERSLIPTLLTWTESMDTDARQKLFSTHFALIKSRFNESAFSHAIAHLPIQQRSFLEQAFNLSSADKMFYDNTVIETPSLGLTRVVTMSFREGVLVSYVPESAESGELLDWLSRRDHVIRSLLGQRLPVLTPLAAIVADLQNSVRICAELPPDEYFQLINDIWSSMDPIFRKHYGAYGKHTGDGMVYYFFPQPDKNYLANALHCACEIREMMREISHRWALKKHWPNQLYMNIGICEGEEWLGTFKTTTNYELVVLGETLNIAARLSDMARLGKIWATKSLVSKLSIDERESLDYGVTRTGLDQEVFVANSYAQVSSLIDRDDPKGNKLMDIASCAVTEIKGFK